MSDICSPGEPSTELNPCIEPQTLADIFHVDAFQSTILATITIMASLAAVYIVLRGGSLILSKIKGSEYKESDSRSLSTYYDDDHIDTRHYSSNSYDDVIDGVDYDRVD